MKMIPLSFLMVAASAGAHGAGPGLPQVAVDASSPLSPEPESAEVTVAEPVDQPAAPCAGFAESEAKRRAEAGPCPYCPCSCSPETGETQCAPCAACDPSKQAAPDLRMPSSSPTLSSACTPSCLDDQALGYLGAAGELEKAGRKGEALRLYRKVLTLNLDEVSHRRAESEIATLSAVDRTGPAPGRFYGLGLGAESGLMFSVGSWFFLDEGLNAEPPGELMFLLTSAATAYGSYYGKKLAQRYHLSRAEGEYALLMGNWAMVSTGLAWFILERQNLLGVGNELMPLGIAAMGTGGAILGARGARHLALDRGSATLAWLGAFVGATDAVLLATAWDPEFAEGHIPDLIIAGSLAGMTLGTWWGRTRAFSASRARLLSLGSYLGMGASAAAASLMGAEDGRAITGATVAGSFAGVGLAYIATSGLERGATAQGLRIGPPLVYRDARGLNIRGPLVSWRW